jgi:hypothetical protein
MDQMESGKAAFRLKMRQSSTPLSALTLAGVAVSLAACGGYQKNPVTDIDTLRSGGRAELNRGHEKPQVITEYVRVEVPKEVIVEKPIVRYEQVEVIREQATVDGRFVAISVEPGMTFTEGKQGRFNIRARVLVPDVQIRLVGRSLPSGAQITADDREPGLYRLSWTPALNTVPANTSHKLELGKVAVEITGAKDAETRKKLEGLVREQEFSMLVLRDSTPPSNMELSLAQQVQEGDQVPFTLTVTVPGLDGRTAQKPRASFYYDGMSTSQGSDLLQLDGSRYIIADASKTEPEFLGDGKWRFHQIFDTKNIPVQPQLLRNGSVSRDAQGVQVRFSYKVMSPNGSAAAEKVQTMTIAYASNRNDAVPRFDMSAMPANKLTPGPGDTVELSFSVSASRTDAEVVMSLPDLSRAPGAPSLTCQVGSSPAAQSCQLKWAIPCTARVQDITRDIQIRAQAKVGSWQSTAVTQVIKVEGSRNRNAACAPAAAPSPTPAPRVSVTPAPRVSVTPAPRGTPAQQRTAPRPSPTPRRN